jgi:hypothetical protein
VTGPGRPPHRPRRERRWPPALALLVLAVLPLLLPDRFRLGPVWFLPAAGVGFLLVVLLADPEELSRRASGVRVCSIVLTLGLIVGSVWFAARLTYELIGGGPVTQSASALLASSALIWINSNVVFGLLYWELDSGGPAGRARRTPRYPDFAFPQHMNPDIAPADWPPVFVDYLYVGLTNATAFSPTDTMPLTPWAKLSMALQSAISMVVLSLVLARAINILV